MTDTDQHDLDAALILLQSAFRTDLDYLQLEAYREGLKGFSGTLIKAAASEAIKNEKQFPTIAVIREYAAMAHRARSTARLLPPANQYSDSVTQEGLRLIRECRDRIIAKMAMPKVRVIDREPGEEG